MRLLCGLAAFFLGFTLVVSATGCSTRNIDSEERARLNSLDAAGVVRAYFESGDPAVEIYLSTPPEATQREASNYVPDKERAGGVDNLVISGGSPSDAEIVGAEGYGDIRQFIVEYDSRKRNSIGDSPGGRFFFVYTGTEPESGRIKVLGVGTGP